MRRRVALAVVGLGIVALAAGAAGVVAIGRSGPAPPEPPGLDTVSNRGTPFDGVVDEAERRILDVSGVVEPLRVLGRAGATIVYLGRGSGGATCFLSGTVGGPRFGSVACPSGSADPPFPSAEVPILDLSTYAVKQGTSEMLLLDAAGVAADGVARVGFVAAGGTTRWLEVEDNLFGDARFTSRPVAKLVAIDPSGTVVHERSLRP